MVTAESNDLDLLQHQSSRLTDIFRDFRDRRVVWDLLAKRRNPITLQPELHRYAEGIDIQSPDLEWALTQHVNILMLNGTKIDCVSLDSSDKATADVDDVRIFLGCQWRRQNENRVLDKAFGRSIVKYGVAVARLFWLEDNDSDDEEDEEAEKALFRIEHVNPLECSWHPLQNPEIFIQKSVVKWIEARDLRGADDQFLSLDQWNNLTYMGEREPEATWNSFASRVQNIVIITRAYLDKETNKWMLGEYAYPGNSSGEILTSAQPLTLSECECPLNRCPYFVIPGAGEDQFEQDPHLRYRPMMYRLYVYVQEYNFWRTVLSAMARKYSGDNVLYLNLSTIKPEAAAILENVFPTEGSGANRKLTFTLPDPGSGELTVSPAAIERWPAEIEQHALAMFEECKKLIQDAMPNRFMTGEAFGEVRDGTGTAVINMTEAARIPYSAELTMIDGGIKSLLQAMVDCLVEYGEDSPEYAKQKYYVVSTGAEPVSRSVSAATTVWVDYKKLCRPFNITVVTENLTQAEESQKALMALQDFGQGIIDDLQLYEARGFEDPVKQQERLQKYKFRKMQEPHTDQIILQSLNVLFSSFAEINTAQLQGLPLASPPSPQQPQQQGQPFQMVPNRQAGGAPQWKPGQDASELPPTETRGGQVTPRATRSGPQPMQPSPIPGPTGGNSPMMGR